MIDVKAIVARKKEEVKATVQKYPENSIKLSIIQVGDNPASNAYVKGKLKDCAEVGIVGELHKFEENVAPVDIYKLVKKLNADANCRGIIVQLPLPKQFTKEWQAVINDAIDMMKDVDGFKRGSIYTPCTPKGIMSILDDICEQLECDTLAGTTVCVIGRSEIVGKPTVNLLIDSGCTVINCNSHTKDLDKWLRESSIIITAVGKPNFLSLDNTVSWRDKIVIDVGINRDEDGKLCGDCSRELYYKTDWITPVPNGVGLMTRVSLLENVVEFL